jgi:hypothetical protein
LLPLFGLLLFVAACDSTDPSDDPVDEPDIEEPTPDLFLLEPTYFSEVNFPTGGRGPQRYLDPVASNLVFGVEDGAFGTANTVATTRQEVDLMTTLAAQGYGPSAVFETRVLEYARLTLQAPAGGTLGFLEYVNVVFSADGLPDRVVGGQSYPYDVTEVDVYIDSYYVQEYILQPSFRVHLVLDAYQEPSVAGAHRFTLTFDTQFRVYDGDPASSQVVFEREMYLRDVLQYQGYDVGDVVSARVTEVALLDGDPYSSANPGVLDERLDVARIDIGSPETGEMEEAAALEAFEMETNSYGNVQSIARATADLDVTDIVRRTGRLLLGGVLELDEAAASRGEYYRATLEVEVAFEVPMPRGPRSENDGDRTMEIRVPMRVPVAAKWPTAETSAAEGVS